MRVIALAGVVLALACGPRLDQPAEPVWGKQACDHCMMLVSERRSAAQAVSVGGTRKFFDDPGCLVEWLESTGEIPMGVWVRAADDSGWVDAYLTRYTGGHRTPMDYGYLPSADGVSFEKLRSALREQHYQRSGVRR
jgi:hypothetical protein